jgi:hypothetical protein
MAAPAAYPNKPVCESRASSEMDWRHLGTATYPPTAGTLQNRPQIPSRPKRAQNVAVFNRGFARGTSQFTFSSSRAFIVSRRTRSIKDHEAKIVTGSAMATNMSAVTFCNHPASRNPLAR